MLLTQEEWADLAAMVRHYRMCTQWVEHPTTCLRSKSELEHIAKLVRRRKLANRIIDAAEV